MEKLIEFLSPNEKKIIPHLEERKISVICKKSNLDMVAVLRSLEYLQSKKIVELEVVKKRIIDVDVNGALYRKKGLPERRLLELLNKKRIIPLSEAQSSSKLSPDEFKASIGALKKKALIELNNGKIVLSGSREEISKKMLEESLLESLPVFESDLYPEQLFALKSLQKRKGIILFEEKRDTIIKITKLGSDVMKSKELSVELIEQITPEILRDPKKWTGKKFRRYDVSAPLPKINGGKRHFVNSSIDYARSVWTDMGFSEMIGNMTVSSFWTFDALFTAQDHPVRDMHDTFYLGKTTPLPDKKIVNAVKECHEKGITGSRGWKYNWDPEDAKKMVLRTHTTCLSSQTLATLRKEDLPKKYFAIGKVFRNETVDWSHGFEFYQTEGIVVDTNTNFRDLLGYLKQFYSKMGFDKIRFTPAYFPYTEPSVEVNVWHPEKKVWLELGGAGILRPEITVPLLGFDAPVLAWGLGFDRIITDYFGIKDLRELYKNDITKLRKAKAWMKI